MNQTLSDIIIDKIVNYWSVEYVEIFLMDGTQHFTFDVNTVNSRGFPALASLVLFRKKLSVRDKAIIRLLLEHGANPLFTRDDMMGHTLIYMLTDFQDSEIIIQFLHYVEDINCSIHEWYWITPLHFATNWEDETVVKYVLTRNPHLDIPDNRGHTPLISAILRKKYDILKLLIDEGANIESRDDYGNTAIILAAGRKYFSMVTLLLENGANLMATNFHGLNALHNFLLTHFKPRRFELFDILISRCDINALSTCNQTPFHFFLISTKNGSINIVKEFIKNGAKLNIQDLDGDSELHIIARNPSVPVSLIIYLMKNGADASLRNRKNETFFDTLLLVDQRKRKAMELIKYLVVEEIAGRLEICMEIQNRINVDRELQDFQYSCRLEADVLNSRFFLMDQSRLVEHCHLN